jgi:predicted nuclease of predicted toxin-antitoxin system
MRFLIDEQLPPGLARWLRTVGHHAEHVRDIGLGGSGDRRLWDHAKASRAVLVTKDQDFVDARTLDADGPAILWVRLGNTRSRILLATFERAMPAIVARLEQGEGIVHLIAATTSSM